MTAPYDAGLHAGFHRIARCGDKIIGTYSGKSYVLYDDKSRVSIRNLKPGELDALVIELAQLVASTRDRWVKYGKGEQDENTI